MTKRKHRRTSKGRLTPRARTIIQAQWTTAAAAICVQDVCAELELEMIETAILAHRDNPKTSLLCPICESRMHLQHEEALPDFVGLDIKIHRLVCTTCSMTTGRAYHPSLGYHAMVR